MTPEKRIPELDAARGICILSMVVIHFIYDITQLYPVLHWTPPPLYWSLKNWGGSIFFLLSGICATLGHRPLRRGLTVLSCGIGVSAVTSVFGFAPIRFGVLHCLGLCMTLWPLFRCSAPFTLLWAGSGLWAMGAIFSDYTVAAEFLYPLGLTAANFESADYFPLLPYLGFFLLGAYVGKTQYRSRRSLLPVSLFSNPFLRFFCSCGRRSLPIYLLHQPVLILLLEAAIFLGGIPHET